MHTTPYLLSPSQAVRDRPAYASLVAAQVAQAAARAAMPAAEARFKSHVEGIYAAMAHRDLATGELTPTPPLPNPLGAESWVLANAFPPSACATSAARALDRANRNCGIRTSAVTHYQHALARDAMVQCLATLTGLPPATLIADAMAADNSGT